MVNYDNTQVLRAVNSVFEVETESLLALEALKLSEISLYYSATSKDI